MNKKIRNFVNNYKLKSWIMPTPPSGLTPVQLTKWLFEQDEIGWLKLDTFIDLNDWKKESLVAEKFYVNHRGSTNYQDSEHVGWKSCCIHGLGVDKTTAEEAANTHLFHWTELADLTPTITKFWKDVFPVECYRRLRFMKLEPGGFIGIHNDLPVEFPRGVTLKELDPLNHTISVNVAVIHPDNCLFVNEEFGTVPFSEGDSYIINITRNHCVVNNSHTARIHVIAECVIGNRLDDFAQLIYNSYQKSYGYN